MKNRKMSWRRLSEASLLAAREEQRVEHGGAQATAISGSCAPRLARPQNKAGYEHAIDAAGLAAAYAFEICRNHPFIDGNKRAALLAAEAFLLDTGLG